MEDPLKPAPKRRVTGGVVVAAIVLIVVVLGFVGRNIGHILESRHAETSDPATHEGQ